MLMSRAFRTAFNLSLPVLGAYWFLGITYGLLAANMGYSVWIPISMALCVYSGSVEFIALTLLLGTFQPLSAFVMAFMVGARHLFYGISMLDRYRGAGWRKPMLIYWLSDETFAVNFSNIDRMKARGNQFACYLWVWAHDCFYWVAGGMMAYLLGIFLGKSILRHLLGLDFLGTVLFVAIFMDDYVRHKATHLSSWLGVAAGAVCFYLFGPQQFIIPTMLCILAVLFVNYKQHNP